LNQAKLYLPLGEQNMHNELICKYHDVISKSKFGLGSAKIFERKIELKDEAPAYIKKRA
jgi:hypothetical protein